MSTGLTLEIESTKLEDTLRIGEVVGRNLKGGETIELVGDVGAGKTVFVKGLAKGAGSTDVVSSPSFTISRVYDCENFTINHFDFYRLKDAGIIRNELDELVGDEKTVEVIEWSDIVTDVLPVSKMKIEIIAVSEETRIIKIAVSENLDYLLEGLNVFNN